jgi:uncharacterized cupredoxin-like copper-binding protein
MKAPIRTGIALVATLLLSASAWAAAGHSGQGHDNSFSAGEPGDPMKPARIVQITMEESEGKMLYSPAHLEIRKGDQIKFMLRNSGELDHEIVLATTGENLKHAEAMQKSPEMDHDDPNARELAPKKTDEMFWKFSKPGEFEYSCLIHGHREAGMIGTIVVR